MPMRYSELAAPRNSALRDRCATRNSDMTGILGGASRSPSHALRLRADRPKARRIGIAVVLYGGAGADVVFGAVAVGNRQALVSMRVFDLVEAAAHVADPPGARRIAVAFDLASIK